jgi:hypothetical protein
VRHMHACMDAARGVRRHASCPLTGAHTCARAHGQQPPLQVRQLVLGCPALLSEKPLELQRKVCDTVVWRVCLKELCLLRSACVEYFWAPLLLRARVVSCTTSPSPHPIYTHRWTSCSRSSTWSCRTCWHTPHTSVHHSCRCVCVCVCVCVCRACCGARADEGTTTHPNAARPRHDAFQHVMHRVLRAGHRSAPRLCDRQGL